MLRKFLTRIELHDGTAEDYAQLDVYMAEAKFYREIFGDNDKPYRLPSAEYFSYGALTIRDVKHLATLAADRVGKSYWLLTVEYVNATWTLKQG